MKNRSVQKWLPWAFATTASMSTLISSLVCYGLNEQRLTLVTKTRILDGQVATLAQEKQTLENEKQQLSNQIAELTQNKQNLEVGLEAIATCATYVDQAIDIPIMDLFNDFSSISLDKLIGLVGDAWQVVDALHAFSGGECQQFRETVQVTLVQSRSTETQTESLPVANPEQQPTPAAAPVPNPETIETTVQ
ncbi:MAG: hypothetical protein ACPGVO_07235 [Spirulinaceae cyanobacterium]